KADELATIGFQTWRAGGDVMVRMEGHAPHTWVTGLAARGHHVEPAEEFDHGFGHAQLITVAGDHLAGASDPRARGGAATSWCAPGDPRGPGRGEGCRRWGPPP